MTAQSGDYSVGQVTGAAPLASPTFSGVMTHPDGTTVSASGWGGSPTFLSNVTINGNLSVAGNISQSSTSPTQWSGKEWTSTTVTVPSGMDYSLGVGSDNTFKCQLASGASCMPSGSGAVSSVFGRTGAVMAQSGDYSVGQVTGAVANTTTVNGHALSANVTVSASDVTTGTLPHAQLPALVSGDIPNNAANTSGTAANLSGTPGLPNGTTATTQSAGITRLRWLLRRMWRLRCRLARCHLCCFLITTISTRLDLSGGTNVGSLVGFVVPYAVTTTKVVYKVGSAADNTANNYGVGIYNSSGTLVLHYAAAGTTFAPSSGKKSGSWIEGSTTLQPGKYYVMMTSNCSSSCATFTGTGTNAGTFYFNGSFSVTTGGTLPSSITAPGTGFESFGAQVLSMVWE